MLKYERKTDKSNHIKALVSDMTLSEKIGQQLLRKLKGTESKPRNSSLCSESHDYNVTSSGARLNTETQKT